MASKKKGPKDSVRRYDRNGNPYYVDKTSGKRVSRERWERDKKRARKQATPKPPTKPTKPGKPTPATPPAPPPPIPPFGPGVSDDGWPLDEYGEFDDDAFAIEGEDDT